MNVISILILVFITCCGIPTATRRRKGKAVKWTCEDDGCDKDWKGGWMLHFHHKRPQFEGGGHEEDNLELLCVEHHRDRHFVMGRSWRRKGDWRRANANFGAARLLNSQNRRQRNK